VVPRLAAVCRRPWLLLPGTALLVSAAFLPHSVAGAVLFIVGVAMILAQIPISIGLGAETVRHHRTQTDSLPVQVLTW
jgi:hypothetical protein